MIQQANPNCSVCGVPKTKDNTTILKKTERFSSICKPCKARASNEYFHSHRAACLEAKRVWKAKHWSEVRERDLKYQRENKGLIKERVNKRYVAHWAENQERGKTRKAENRERNKMGMRKWRAEHKEQIKATTRKKREQNRFKLIAAYGGKCVKCGFSDIRALQIDHVHGGGQAELKAHRANMSGYYLLCLQGKAKGKYQLLCANCNWIKRSENNELGSRVNEVPGMNPNANGAEIDG